MSDTKKNDNILSTMEEIVIPMNEEENKNEEELNNLNAEEENPGGGKGGEETPKFEVTDSLIERGVKAGLSVAAIKGFTSAEMAEEYLSTLEAAKASASKPNGQNDESDDTPELDLSEFTEENGFDASLVKTLKSMKAVMDAQSKELKALKAAGASAVNATFFDQQFNGLEDGVKKHIDAIKKGQLKAKFDFLESAYKAAGTKMSREEIFKEAKALVLGDLVQKSQQESKAAEIEKRAGLRLAPAGGTPTGKKVTQEEKENNILNELRDKFKLG